MGKYISAFGGVVAMLLGVWGIFAWRSQFVVVLQGCLPIMMIFGGLIALFLGISEIKDEMAAKKEEKKQEDKK